MVSQLDYHVLLQQSSMYWIAGPALLSFGPACFRLDQIFKSGGPSYKLTLVRQATDTSPPCFS